MALAIRREEQWEDVAKTVFYAGRYGDFLSLVDGPPSALSPSLCLLAAKALSRIGRSEESLELLETLADPARFGPDLAVHALLQRAIVEVAIGRESSFVSCLDEAARLVVSSRDPELAFRLQLHQAMHAWTKRDFSATATYARSAMSSTHPETLALAGQFLGFVAASRGRYMEQIAILENALAELDRMPTRDLWVEASILHNISGIIQDLYLPAVARRMSDRAEAIEWPEELTLPRHHILRSLAYFRSLGSDPFLPFEYLDRASATAPTDGWKFISRLDRLFLYQEMSGDRILRNYDAAKEMQHAEDLAARIDWTTSHGEDRYGLLVLSELLSKSRPRDAAAYLAQYRQSRQSMSPTLMGRSDARWTAIEDFVEGIVVTANGDAARGVELIGKAFTFWDDVGFSWRATRAAIKLYELTGEERHIDWAFRESRRYPYSWLSDAVSRAGHR